MYNGTVIIDAFDLPSHLRITWPRLEIQVQGTAISQLAGTVNFLASRLDMPSRVTGAGKRSSVTEVDALVELPIEEHGAASSENVTAAVEFKTCGQFRVRRGRTIADIFGNEEELGWVLPGLQQAHGYACHEGVALFAVYSYEVVIFGARSSVDDKRIKLSDPVWLDRQNPSAKSLWLRFMQLSAERHQEREAFDPDLVPDTGDGYIIDIAAGPDGQPAWRLVLDRSANDKGFTALPPPAVQKTSLCQNRRLPRRAISRAISRALALALPLPFKAPSKLALRRTSSLKSRFSSPSYTLDMRPSRRLPRRAISRAISRALALALPLPFKAPSKLALRRTSSLKSRFSSPSYTLDMRPSRRLPRRAISRALALALPLPFKAPSKLALRSTSSLKSRFSSPSYTLDMRPSRRLPRRSISRALALALPLPFKAPSKLALRSTSSLKSRFSSPSYTLNMRPSRRLPRRAISRALALPLPFMRSKQLGQSYSSKFHCMRARCHVSWRAPSMESM
ncbi:g1815 [Coccomyxa viridis]|uniref:G1815 protein n=1 Tax=Coccomyxa viridis TaxID=1274662 RepID=A0ABP1FLU2_9CHLO